jgi:hypothetical protein
VKAWAKAVSGAAERQPCEPVHENWTRQSVALVDMMPAIDQRVERVCDGIAFILTNGIGTIAAMLHAEASWTEHLAYEARKTVH